MKLEVIVAAYMNEALGTPSFLNCVVIQKL